MCVCALAAQVAAAANKVVNDRIGSRSSAEEARTRGETLNALAER
jgi:hypothetical protein